MSPGASWAVQDLCPFPSGGSVCPESLQSPLSPQCLCPLLIPPELCPCATTWPCSCSSLALSQFQGWSGPARSLQDVPGALKCPLWGGIPAPRGQHLFPHPAGSPCYLLEGQGRCGCPPGQREATLGDFYFVTNHILCVLIDFCWW